MTDDPDPPVRDLDTFEEGYLQGRPPWDVDGPQPALVARAEAGQIAGEVLDAGCGTGENALYLAEQGHRVLGVDSAPTAIARAREKAKARGLDDLTEFAVHDALALSDLGRTFDTVVDSGLFHVFDDEERDVWARELTRVLRPGGHYVVLCFSDEEPPGRGPRRVSQGEIREVFGAPDWEVEAIEAATFETREGDWAPKAWVAVVRRS